MADPAADPPADTADPVANAVVTPRASLFLRQMVQAALANRDAAPRAWTAHAHALLANLLMNDYLNSWNNAGPSELQQAREAADLAINLDPDLPAAHHAAGLIKRARGDHAAALAEFERAIALDAGYARAHAQVGNQKVLSGRASESHRHFAEARRLNRRHPAIGYFDWGEGRAYLEEENWQEAVRWLRRSVAALPTVWYNRCYLAYAQNQAGATSEARRTVRRFLDHPEFGEDGLKRAIARLHANAARKDMGDWLEQIAKS